MPEPLQGQDTSKNPENPENLENPKNPENSKNPENPGNPGNPENTENPRRLAAHPPGSGRERVQGTDPPESGRERVQGADPPGSGRERVQAAHSPGPGRERVQTGVRMEKRLVKVLKALAELHDLTLGDLLEGIVLHAFAGRIPFSPAALGRIAELERIYGLETGSSAGRQPLPALGQEFAP